MNTSPRCPAASLNTPPMRVVWREALRARARRRARHPFTMIVAPTTGAKSMVVEDHPDERVRDRDGRDRPARLDEWMSTPTTGSIAFAAITGRLRPTPRAGGGAR
jgi:hypothetical protein